MTIATEAIVAGPFTGNGVTSAFAFAFKVFADTDVLVKHTTTAGVDSTSVLTTNYTVARNADQDNNPGGTITWKVAGVTTALPNGEKLTITSQVPNTQATALPSGGSYAAKTVERMIDKATILIKQMLRDVTRSLRQPITDATVMNELPNAATRRGMFLFFQDTAAAQPVAAAVTSGAAVTAAWKAVIESTTLALGRAAMGFSAYFDSLVAVANAAAARVILDVPSNAEAAALAAAQWTTGDVKLTLKTAADSGWVMMNDGTIGSATSGGTTRANADTVALFTLLWNNVADAQAPVSGGRGANAAADFAANKTIALTKVLGRAIGISGAGAGLTSRVLGLTTGNETETLSIAQLAAHTHTIGQSVTTDGPVQNPALDDAGSSISSGSTGSGSAHANMQPTGFMNCMIKL